MLKFILFLIAILQLIVPGRSLAQGNTSNFVSIVNPIRGQDFWEISNQRPIDAVLGQKEILAKYNISATWLLRFDALQDLGIIDTLISEKDKDDIGLFLEITPSWNQAAGIEYHRSESWHAAGSALLTGYEQADREKLIDAAFDKFKKVFGTYPKSVGAWWIDSYSLSFMQKKYGITGALIVADQYTTDNYQIWGQYFSTPYYPAKNNALHPAQTLENKLPVVIVQWAARDPVNAYGKGVEESTFSVQANDYIDYHNLDTEYFSKLVEIYTNQPFNKFSHLVVGLENSYSWNKYSDEYRRQITVLEEKRNSSQFLVIPLRDFASWYQQTFPRLSPPQLIFANDPLGTNKKAVWFMNSYYRVGWFFNQDGSVLRDIRQYIDGEEELCFKKRCDSVNFATSATRVLDDVSFGHKWVVDEGKINNFEVLKSGENFIINYLNEANTLRTIEFLPRDISVDGKISSIDGAILDAVKQDTAGIKQSAEFTNGGFSWTIPGVISEAVKFLLFLFLVCLIPGFVLLSRIADKDTEFFKKIFLSLIIGLVSLTTLFYLGSLLNLRIIVFPYVILNLFLFVKLKLFTLHKTPKITHKTLLPFLVIIAGTIFQNIPTFKNGLIFPFGMGFWGPNTHDGIWHISLINQLVKGFPLQNPIFANTQLQNYHFFYDLLIAATTTLTKISILDLVFRFYPILFSLLLGIGTYYLTTGLFRKINPTISLYFVYFAGSFGWIVEYINQRNLGGESAFWVNQSISFNLNPPFAVSLIIIIAILQLLPVTKTKITVVIQTLLIGTLIAFKAYGAILILLTLLLVGILKRDLHYMLVFFTSLLICAILLISNFGINKELIIFSPFWFIHSMVDSPDRVGWVRLSLARIAGWETKNWFKLLLAEIISLTLFIVGNLGMRVFSLMTLSKIKTIAKDNSLLFILLFSLFSLLIPVLFIQSGNPWNTIQFSYYGLYITAVVSGAVLYFLTFKLSKLLSIVLIGGILILTPVNSITTASYYVGFLPHGRVDKTELQALEFLSKQEDGIVLTVPYDERLKQKLSEPWSLFVYGSTAYVSALSKKSVYLEDESQNQILLTDYKKRLVASKDFLVNQTPNFLIEKNIRYIYLPRIYNISLDENKLKIKKIYENEEVFIYLVKKV